MREWLRHGILVIACVQAGELSHWQGVSAQHAVLVLGMDEQEVHLHDPALAHGPIVVSSGDFSLAWDEMNCRYAIIKERG